LPRSRDSPDTASTLLVAAGDNPHRITHERAFARLCGSSPVPFNSGQTQNRYRLNRGGDRQANAVRVDRPRPNVANRATRDSRLDKPSQIIGCRIGQGYLFAEPQPADVSPPQKGLTRG
jgi:Transposase IS116/IS110/IS902 family